jgi:YggT family protein
VVTLVLGIIQSIVNILFDAYIAILFIRMIVDWVLVLSRRVPRGVWGGIVRVIYQLTEPPLAWLRRYIRPIPLGPVSFDVGYLVLWFGVGFLQWLFNYLFGLLIG